MDYPPTALTRSIKNGNTKKAAGVGRVGYVFVPIDRASDRSSWSRQVNGAIAWWHVWSEVYERSARKCLNREFSCLESRARPAQQGTSEPRKLQEVLDVCLHKKRSSLHLCPTRPGSQSALLRCWMTQLECQEKALEVNHPRPPSPSPRNLGGNMGEAFLVFEVVGSGLFLLKIHGTIGTMGLFRGRCWNCGRKFHSNLLRKSVASFSEESVEAAAHGRTKKMQADAYS